MPCRRRRARWRRWRLWARRSLPATAMDRHLRTTKEPARAWTHFCGSPLSVSLDWRAPDLFPLCCARRFARVRVSSSSGSQSRLACCGRSGFTLPSHQAPPMRVLRRGARPSRLGCSRSCLPDLVATSGRRACDPAYGVRIEYSGRRGLLYVEDFGVHDAEFLGAV